MRVVEGKHYSTQELANPSEKKNGDQHHPKHCNRRLQRLCRSGHRAGPLGGGRRQRPRRRAKPRIRQGETPERTGERLTGTLAVL